ncbi:MAG: SIS domain-containing protein [Deltaproteobacteria bacterium]
MLVKNYIDELFNILKNVEVTDHQDHALDREDAVWHLTSVLKALKVTDNKLMFIGNGGSAAIASHMAVDYWKTTGIPALCFNEGAQLTCLGNDFGYQAVFEKPIEVFARPGDILIAISSSGKSPNIIRGVEAATRLRCRIITLSGFLPDNVLRSLGEYNFYCASTEYGFIELTHQIILHMLLDLMSK